MNTFHQVRKKRDDVEYFIEREDGEECEFEANYVHMGWYSHTAEELLDFTLITKAMLSTASDKCATWLQGRCSQ